MEVFLHVYDLSNGMARQVSPMILGKQIDAIWHTGVVAYGKEFYFGGGICEGSPHSTPYGNPLRRDYMGATTHNEQEFRAFLNSIAHKFTMMTYDILENNCNNFSQECVSYLIPGKSIPQEILDLPGEALNSPIGPMLRPMLESTTRQIQEASAGHQIKPSATSPSQARSPGTTTDQPGSLCVSQTPVRFLAGDRDKITSKLCDWDPLYQSTSRSTVQALNESIGRLPDDKAFPALDLLRLAVIEDGFTDINGVMVKLPAYLNRFVGDIENKQRPAVMMTFRLVANVLAVQTLQGLTPDQIDDLLEKAGKALSHPHHLVRQAAAAVLCNLAARYGRSEDVATRLIFLLADRINSFDVSKDATDPREATYLLAAAYLLVSLNLETKMLAVSLELDVEPFLELPGVLKACAGEIAALLNRRSCP